MGSKDDPVYQSTSTTGQPADLGDGEYQVLTFSRDLRTLCLSRSFWMLRAILWRAPLVTFCGRAEGDRKLEMGG